MKSKDTGCGSISTVISSIVLLCVSSIIVIIIMIIIITIIIIITLELLLTIFFQMINIGLFVKIIKSNKMNELLD